MHELGRTASMPSLPLYRALADRLRHSIESGTLRSGEKLASLRDVTAQQKVSLATALHAYRLLEEQGLIESRPQAGYFVVDRALQLQEPGVPRPPPAPTTGSLAELSADLFAALADRDLITLGAGVLSGDLFPVQALRRATTRVLRQKPGILTEYPFGV